MKIMTVLPGNAEKPDISRYLETEKLPEEDRHLLTLVRKLQDTEINKYISRNSPFSGIWENIIHQEEDDLPGETKELMAEYLFPRLKKLCAEQGENSLFFLLHNGKKPLKQIILNRSGDKGRSSTLFSGKEKLSLLLFVAG